MVHGLRDVRRHGLAQGAKRGRLAGEHARDDGLRSGTAEGRLAGDHLVGHRAQRIDVGARVHRLLAHRLLGRHVLRRSQAQPRLRHALAARLLHRQGNAEVGHQRVLVARTALQENVLGLDVAVNHPAFVRVLQRTRHLARDLHRIRNRQLRLALKP